MLNLKQYGSVIVSFYLIVTPAYALPTGAKVAHGDAKFKVEQNKMEIKTSDKAIINYKTFNIGSKEIVQFIQPSSSSIVLNRVITANPSNILGTLNANGRVFLINPSGIIFGKNSHINVNGLIATTLNITDQDFLNSNYKFSQLKNMPKSYIIQSGNIQVANNGFVILAAPFVKNDGVILARRGVIHIGAVDNFYINFDREGVVMFSYHPSSIDTNQNNVVLSKEAAENIILNVINHPGVQEELKIVKEDGIIKLINGSGYATISGKLITSSQDKAGNVNIVAQKFIDLNNLQILANALEIGNGGNINIFSNGSAYGNLDVLLSAKGGKLGGDGGFIEFSAKKSVILNGMQVDTLAPKGKIGTFYVDPEDIIITSDQVYNTNPELEATNSIVLTSYHYLASVDNTDISLFAPNIILEDHTRIKSGGDVLLKTTSKDGKTLYKNTSIKIGNIVLISGNKVDLEAISSNEANEEATLKLADNLSDFIDAMSGIKVSYKSSQASSSITMGDSEIKATDIIIHTESSASVNVKRKSVGLALAFGDVSASSKINLNSSVLLADNDIKISSTANTINNTEAVSSNGFYNKETQRVMSVDSNLAFAYTNTKTTAETNINKHSLIKAGKDITINATGFKDIKTKSTAASYSDGVLGASMAMTKSDSNVKVYIGKDSAELSAYIVAGGKLDISANTNIKRILTRSSSGVGNGLVAKWKLESTPNLSDLLSKTKKAEGALKDELNSKDSKANSKGDVKGQNALSASVAYSESTNNNDVVIEDNSNFSAQNDINIKSNLDFYENEQVQEENDPDYLFGDYGVKTTAISTIDSTDKNPKENSASGAVAITDITNNSNVNIGDYTALNSFHGDINIEALTSMRYNINWDAFKLQTSYSTEMGTEITTFEQIGKNLLHEVGGKGADIGSFRTNLFTSFAESNAQGNKNSLAGSYNSFKLKNNTITHIGKNVFINKDTTNTDYQNVNIQAKSDIQTINFSGIIGWLFFGSKSGNLGVGGAYLGANYSDTVKAYVDSETKINANALKVEAIKEANNFSLATAGGKDSKYSVSGSISDLVVNDTVYAYLNKVNVYTKNGGFNNNYDNVIINAQNHLDTNNGSGGVSLGQSVGIGASITKNTITRDTEAYMINNSNISSDAYKKLKILSNNLGYIGAYTVSAASVSPKVDANEKKSSKAGAFGLSVSAESGLNYINDTAKAYLDNSYINNHNAFVTIQANNDTDYIGLAGGASLDIGASAGVGLSGSYTGNYIQNTVESYINNSILDINSLDVLSKNSGKSIIYTVSLSGGSGLTNVAGSVGIDKITNTAKSYIQSSDITMHNILDLKASNDMTIENYAGGVGISKFAGIGAAYASNDVVNKTYTYMDSSIVNNSYNQINMESSENGKLTTLAVGGAVGGSGLAASASIINNNIQDEIKSYISADNSVSRINSRYMNIHAFDNTNIYSIAGFISISKYLGVGGGFITNKIDNSLYTGVSKANVDVSELKISSISDKDITGIVAGGSGAIVGLAGNNIYTDITDTINSVITDSKIDVDSMALHAIEQNDISSKAGAIAIGAVGIGASVNTVNISNDIKSYIENSDLTVANHSTIFDTKVLKQSVHGLSVLSLANENVDIESANASYALASINGNFNNLHIADDLQSYIYNSNINRNFNDANNFQDVLVRSIVNDNVLSREGAFAISMGEGMGGSASNIDIKNSTNSYVESSYISAKNKFVLKAQEKEQILPEVVSAATGITKGMAGSVSIINVNNNNDVKMKNSYISSSKDVDVKASDITLLGYQNDKASEMKVGAVGISINMPSSGTSVGMGASVSINHIKNKSVVTMSSSNSLNSMNQMDILAYNKADIINNIKAGALSTSFSGAGSIVINNISSTTQVNFIDGADLNQNQDKVYRNEDVSLQNVSIKANSENSVKDTLTTAAIGGLAAAGSIDITTMSYQTNVNIKSHDTLSPYARDKEIFSRNNLNIESTNTQTFQSHATTGGVAGEEVTGSIVIANLDNHDLLNFDTFKNISGNTADVATKEVNNVDSTDTVMTGLFGTGLANDVHVNIGKYISLRAGNTLNISSTNKYDNLSITSGNYALAGMSYGGSVALAYLGANNGINILNDYMQANDVVLNSNYEITKANVDSYTGQAGIITSLGAAYAKVENTYTNIINTKNENNENMEEIKVSNNVVIKANTNENINVNAYGKQGSELFVIGGAYSEIDSQNNPTEVIYGNEILAENDIIISSNYSNNMQAYTEAGSAAGAIAVQGTFAKVNATPTIKVVLPIKNIRSKHDISIFTSVNNYVSAKTKGGDFGLGISVGASQSEALFNPTTLINIDAYRQNGLHADNNIKIQNYLNTNLNDDSIITNNGVYSEAIASVGGLVGAVGAKSVSTFNPNMKTKTDGSLYALNDITIKTKSYVNASAKSNADSFGALSLGLTTATVNVDSVKMETDLVSYGLTNIYAKNNIWLDNYSNVKAVSNSVGGEGGEITVSGTKSNINASNQNELYITNEKVFSDNGSINILTTNDTYLDSTATDTPGALISVNDVVSDVKVNNQISNITVSGSNIQAEHDLNIIANQQREFEHSTATSYIKAAGGVGNAKAYLHYDDSPTIDAFHSDLKVGNNLGEVDLKISNTSLRANNIKLQSDHNPYDYLNGEHTLDAQTKALAGITLSVAAVLKAETHNEAAFVSNVYFKNLSIYDGANYTLQRGVFHNGPHGTYSAVFGNQAIVNNHSLLSTAETVIDDVINNVLDWVTNSDEDYIKSTTAQTIQKGGWQPRYYFDNGVTAKNINRQYASFDDNSFSFYPVTKPNGGFYFYGWETKYNKNPQTQTTLRNNSINRWWESNTNSEWWRNTGKAPFIPSNYSIGAIPVYITHSSGDDDGIFIKDLKGGGGNSGNSSNNGNSNDNTNTQISNIINIYATNFLNGVSQSIETNNLAVLLHLITKQQEAMIFNYKFAPMINQAMFSSNLAPLINPIEIPNFRFNQSSMVKMSQNFNMWDILNNNIGGKKSNKTKTKKAKKTK